MYYSLPITISYLPIYSVKVCTNVIWLGFMINLKKRDYSVSQMDGSPLHTGKAAVACHCDGGAEANNSSSPSRASGACNGGIPASACHCLLSISEVLCHVRLPLSVCDCRGDTGLVWALNTGNGRDCTWHLLGIVSCHTFPVASGTRNMVPIFGPRRLEVAGLWKLILPGQCLVWWANIGHGRVVSCPAPPTIESV